MIAKKLRSFRVACTRQRSRSVERIQPQLLNPMVI